MTRTAPPSRRTLLTGLLLPPLLGACSPAARPAPPSGSADPAAGRRPEAAPFAELERRYGARLGVYAVNHRTGERIGHRQGERFAMCSTFKTYAAGALLREHAPDGAFFARPVAIGAGDILPHSPVTRERVGQAMTVAELCEAAVTVSDNAAANHLLALLGGPAGVTRFARAIGDEVTRLDRREPELNSAEPGDERDTTTPAAIAEGYRAMVLGPALPAAGRERVTAWLRATTTGTRRIRAGLPPSWATGDKTGSGRYGTLNDVAVTWAPDGTRVALAVLSDRRTPDAGTDEALLADAARVAVGPHGLGLTG
ncbi:MULTISPECIES: class A beta-lactamase [Streptomyces]|uniref:class A beta-lactamase n=1 Tax=Streptomyces TaxID=1883 RepID=UPI002248E7F0|nr:class A beta-lactamase [Streptomyces sp. JHD 1]MCX2968377.1 class A beta-lactamase [Streptomyces sp. JHD 1]